MIFKSSKYTDAVDIWAIGCLMAEMFLGGPLFPGKQLIIMVKDLPRWINYKGSFLSLVNPDLRTWRR